MQLNRETETELGHALLIQSDAESVGGRTLVTVTLNGENVLSLFPHEAREMAHVLLRAAGLAEGVGSYDSLLKP